MSTPANRLYNYNLAMMNSPPRSDVDIDRIVHRLGNRPNSDARMEGNSFPFEPPRGPVKDLNAASTLTSLAKKPTVKDVGEDFDIPQRFTKSGRKKATPFPLKVRAWWLELLCCNNYRRHTVSYSSLMACLTICFFRILLSKPIFS